MLIRPWRLTGAAVLWALVAVVASVLVMALVWVGEYALGLVSAQKRMPNDVRPFIALAAVATQGVFLLVSWRQALRVGDGNIQAGLGEGAIRRPWLIAGLSLVQLVLGGLALAAAQHVPSLAKHLKNAEALNGLFFDGSMWILPGLVLVVILAPLGEELFFRGWLWTGLSRVWHPVPVAFVTGGLWLSLHVGNGLLYPLFLVPAAVMFSVIRHVGGSVQASIMAHVINNGLAAILALLAATLQG